jgi:Integrase core domain.
MDHCDAAGMVGNLGIGGFSAFVTVYGFATDTVGAIAVKGEEADSTTRALASFIGPDHVAKSMHCDCHSSLVKTCKQKAVHRRPTQPGVQQSNGIVEALNGTFLQGARTALVQAGLPTCFWVNALEHWTFLRNTLEKSNNGSAHF